MSEDVGVHQLAGARLFFCFKTAEASFCTPRFFFKRSMNPYKLGLKIQLNN
jgi:hypothetical protein